MGIGRREFLRFTALALGGIALRPLQQITVNGDYYVNTRLGLGFIKPHDWHFNAFIDFAPRLKGQIVQGVPPETEAAFLCDHTSTLLAAISKYGEQEPRFSPSITVFKNTDDWRELKDRAFENVVSESIDGFSQLLKEYEIIESPAPLRLSNCRAARFKACWLFEHRQIDPVCIEDETIVIDQENALYTIHLYDSPATNQGTPDEFKSFLTSIHLA